MNVDAIAAQAGIFIGQNIVWACIIVYGATIFLGNISAFVSFWIAFEGGFGAWGVPLIMLIVFASHITGDTIWYSMGRTLRNTRFGHWVKNRLPGHEKIQANLEKKSRRWMILAKMVYGSNFPVIFLVGWAQIGFKKFIKNSLIAAAIWIPLLLGISYGLFSSLSPLRAVSAFKEFEWVFLAGVILFFVVNYAITKVVAKFLAGTAAKLDRAE